MAMRGSYGKAYIPKGGGGKQEPIGVKSKPVKAPKVANGGSMSPVPKARPQTKGAMPRSPGYWNSGQVY